MVIESLLFPLARPIVSLKGSLQHHFKTTSRGLRTWFCTAQGSERVLDTTCVGRASSSESGVARFVGRADVSRMLAKTPKIRSQGGRRGACKQYLCWQGQQFGKRVSAVRWQGQHFVHARKDQKKGARAAELANKLEAGKQTNKQTNKQENKQTSKPTH